MIIDMLEQFFLWCTILNGGTLLLSSLYCVWAKEWIYGIHSKVFNLNRDSFNNLVVLFIATYKIAFMTFNLFPYIALLILNRG
jgi:hypothetical protein